MWEGKRYCFADRRGSGREIDAFAYTDKTTSNRVKDGGRREGDGV